MTEDKAATTDLPPDAFRGAGAWKSGSSLVACGFSLEVDSLGQAKGNRTECDIAEEDCRQRLALLAAGVQNVDFQPDAYDCQAQFRGLRVAATYRLANHPGLFLVGLVPVDEVNVRVVFNREKARKAALAKFREKDFHQAAALFALLTQHDAQDAQTVRFARAASWHVNLAAGVQGSSRREALAGLGNFYLQANQPESSLEMYYRLYQETTPADAGLLHILVDLSERTGRQKSAAAFLAELHRMDPPLPPGSKSASP